MFMFEEFKIIKTKKIIFFKYVAIWKCLFVCFLSSTFTALLCSCSIGRRIDTSWRSSSLHVIKSCNAGPERVPFGQKPNGVWDFLMGALKVGVGSNITPIYLNCFTSSSSSLPRNILFTSRYQSVHQFWILVNTVVIIYAASLWVLHIMRGTIITLSEKLFTNYNHIICIHLGVYSTNIWLIIYIQHNENKALNQLNSYGRGRFYLPCR